MRVKFQTASPETGRVLYYNFTPKWVNAALEVQLTGLGGVKGGVLSVEILTDGGVVVPKRHEWRVDDTVNRALPIEEQTSGGFTFIGDELKNRSDGSYEPPSYPYYEGMVVKVRVVQATAGDQRFCIACAVKDGDGNKHQARSPPFFVSAARSGKRKNMEARRAQARARAKKRKTTGRAVRNISSSSSSEEESSSSEDSEDEEEETEDADARVAFPVPHTAQATAAVVQSLSGMMPLSPHMPNSPMTPHGSSSSSSSQVGIFNFPQFEPPSPAPSLQLTNDNFVDFDAIHGVVAPDRLIHEMVDAIKLLTENQTAIRTLMEKQTQILQKMN